MSSPKRLAYLTGLALATWPLAAQASAGDEVEDPLIYGGTDVVPCGWPTTVFLGGCTGTLVHPEVVIYAAHCGSGINSVRFGEKGNAPAKSVGTKYCKTNPQGPGMGQGKDHAFCVLSEPVEAPIVPPLMGCETDILQPGQEVTIVGFGNADTGPTGIKREVTTTINGISNGEAHIGGGGKDSCQGDSGGPVFIKLGSQSGGDDTWRVFGITSYGGACGGGGMYSMMHTGMPWIEGELADDGIDITPCFDSNGNWEPTMDCFGFPMEPGAGHGSWANLCDDGPIGGYSASCGPPSNDEPDDTPPAVSITAPMQNATFDTMGTGTIPVQIQVSADDGDGWGVQSVQLLIDGESVPNGELDQAPYGWTPVFPAGQFEIGAIAIDHAGNMAMADPVFIGVDQEAEPPPPPTTDDGGDEGTEGGSQTSGPGPGFGQEPDEIDEGCGCAASSRSSGGWALLGLLGLFGWRRRRHRSVARSSNTLRLLLSLGLVLVACGTDERGAQGSGGVSGGASTEGETAAGDEGTSDGSGSDGAVKLDVAAGDGDGNVEGGEEEGCEKVDFLFVVDNSSSMLDEQQSLISAFPQFISKIQSEVQGQDHHIMVVDSDGDPTFACEPGAHDSEAAWQKWCPDNQAECTASCPSFPTFCTGYACGSAEMNLDDDDRTLGCGVIRPYGGNASNVECGVEGGRRYLTDGQADLPGTFACMARVGTSGHWYEAPISGMRRALSPELNGPGGCNEGFLREDAVLVVVFMSDDNDAAEGPDEVMYGTGGTPQQWYQEVLAAKDGVPENVVMLGVVATGSPTNVNCADYHKGYEAPKFVEFLELFGEQGLMADSCDADYATPFDDAVALIDRACDDFIPPG